MNFENLSTFDKVIMGKITTRRSYASAVLRVVRPSVTRVLVTNPKNLPAIFIIPHERAILLVFCHAISGWWATSPSTLMGDQSDPPAFRNRSHRQISTCNVSTVRASEKSSIMTNGKSYMGFPTSYS